MVCVLSPRSVDELMRRAGAIDGLTVGQLALRVGVGPFSDPVRTKGRVGELVEQALGATARNLDQPDFPELGVELKTIPMTRSGRVSESTFVCAIDLDGVEREEWETSRLWRKLRCVLWVPVESADTAPLPDRHLGTPRLWRPTSSEEALMRGDWTALIGRIAVGGIEEITAHQGQVLQVRPKAANASVRTKVYGPQRQELSAVPRGFYLRARFTENVLWRLSD